MTAKSDGISGKPDARGRRAASADLKYRTAPKTERAQGTSSSAALVRADQSRLSARTRALDAGEQLFALHGVHGTTLREIAAVSGVPVNLISYHFKTKEDLYRAVLTGHAARITAMRRDLLNQLELRHSPNLPPISEIVATLFRPIFLMKDQDAELWANFVGLLNKERGSETWRETIGASIASMLKQYALLLQRALPSTKRADIVFILSLSFLSLTLSSPAEARAIIGDELFADWDDERVEERLVRTLTTAVLALA